MFRRPSRWEEGLVEKRRVPRRPTSPRTRNPAQAPAAPRGRSPGPDPCAHRLADSPARRHYRSFGCTMSRRTHPARPEPEHLHIGASSTRSARPILRRCRSRPTTCSRIGSCRSTIPLASPRRRYSPNMTASYPAGPSRTPASCWRCKTSNTGPRRFTPVSQRPC